MTATITTLQNAIAAQLTTIANGSPVLPFTVRVQEADVADLPEPTDTIDVIVGAPIASNGRTAAELTHDVEAWIEAQCAELPLTPG